MSERMTFEEYGRRWSSLSVRQRKWVQAKARWEQMTCWAVLNEWDPPKTKTLNLDGTSRGRR